MQQLEKGLRICWTTILNTLESLDYNIKWTVLFFNDKKKLDWEYLGIGH